VNKIICGDSLKVLSEIGHARMTFADPPDNLKLKYNGFTDKWKSEDAYLTWMFDVFQAGTFTSDVFWFSHFYKWTSYIHRFACRDNRDIRMFIWRFTFGQHRRTDCGNGYRPILRVSKPGVKWNTNAIRVPSWRQMKYNDRRANPNGRVPDDVWDFPRVCGTFHERRKWHPTQHPEALIERMILMSTKPGDLVVDMFAGSGTVNRVCQRLDENGQGRDCIGIDVSPFYCRKIAEELNIESEGV